MSTSYLLKRFLLANRHITELSHIYHHVYFRDLSAKLINCNDLMVGFFGYSNHQELINQPYMEIISNPDVLQKTIEHDNIVLKTGNKKIFSESFFLKKEDKGLFSVKSPLYDENKLIGLCGISVHFNNQNYSDFMSLLNIISKTFQIELSENSSNLYKSLKSSRPKLSDREADCLFFYLRGHTIKNIAEKLGLSARTIEFYMENIKSKLGVNKRSELLSLAFKSYPELIQ